MTRGEANAAVGVPPHPIADFPEDDFDLVMRVNLKGVFYAVSAEVKAMARGGGGAIVNTSSVGSLIGNGLKSSCYETTFVGHRPGAGARFSRCPAGRPLPVSAQSFVKVLTTYSPPPKKR